MADNPYQPPTIFRDSQPISWRWRKGKWTRIVVAILCGLVEWMIMPEAQDYPELTMKIGMAGFAGGAALGYAACTLAQIALHPKGKSP